MSSSEVKEQLVDWYGGNISDWKRLSKKKRGSYDVRVFENKKLGLIKTVVAEDDECFKPEYFPTGEFWIYVNQKDLDPKNVDESKSYFDSKIVKETYNYDINDESSVSTTLVLKDPTNGLWYDEHTSYLIEDYFGVKNFRTMFDEPSENENTLMQDIPVGDIRQMCENAGMKFLGYRNIFMEGK